MSSTPDAKSNWRGPAVAAGFTLLVLMSILVDERVGSTLGILPVKPHFMDWAAILAAGDAHRAGADVYATPNPFDPLGRPHSYGPWWLLIGKLGFSLSDRWWTGALISVSFAIVAAIVVAPRTWSTTALAVALLVSPPVMLGLERANNDLLVFMMLSAAAWMVAKWPRGSIWGVAAVSSFAAALKLYPLAALAGLLAARARPRMIVAAAILAVCGCAMIAWWYRADYMQTIAAVPKVVTVFTYGFRVFVALSKDAFIQFGSIGLGMIGGAILTACLLRGRLAQLFYSVPLYGGTAFAYVAGSACWVFCYFVNTNLPYRAVLLVLPARLWLKEWDTPGAGGMARRCIALVLILVWTACATGNVHTLLEQQHASLAPLVLTIAAFEQTLALAVTAFLLLSIIGWTWRHYSFLSCKSSRALLTGTS